MEWKVSSTTLDLKTRNFETKTCWFTQQKRLLRIQTNMLDNMKIKHSSWIKTHLDNQSFIHILFFFPTIFRSPPKKPRPMAPPPKFRRWPASHRIAIPVGHSFCRFNGFIPFQWENAPNGTAEKISLITHNIHVWYIYLPAPSEGCHYDTNICVVLRGATTPPVSQVKRHLSHDIIWMEIEPKTTAYMGKRLSLEASVQIQEDWKKTWTSRYGFTTTRNDTNWHVCVGTQHHPTRSKECHYATP